MTPLLTIIQSWQKKCSEVAAQSEDPLVPLVGSAFDALAAITDPNQDQANIERSLKALYDVKHVSESRNIENDPLREMMLGLMEAIHLSMRNITENRNTTANESEKKKSGPRLKRPAARSSDYAMLNGGLVKEEKEEQGVKRQKVSNKRRTSLSRTGTYWETLKAGYRKIPVKKTFTIILYEVDNTYGNEKTEELRWNCGLTDAQVRVGTVVELLFGNEPYKATIVDFAATKEDSDRTINRLIEESRARVMAQIVDAAGEELEKGEEAREEKKEAVDQSRRRSSKVATMDDNEEEVDEVNGDVFDQSSEVASQSEDPLVPPMRSAFDATAAITDPNQDQTGEQTKGRSRLKRTAARSADYAMLNGGLVKEEEEREVKKQKMQNITKEATAGRSMQCVLCEYETSFVRAFVRHLSAKHGTTLTKEGIWFHCECGNLGRSDKHIRSTNCDGMNTSIVRDEELNGEEENEDEEDNVAHVKQKSVVRSMMQCVLCDFETSSVYSYYNHLKRKHATTPKAAGIWFRCHCGNMCMSERHVREKKCDLLNTSIVREDEAILMADGYKEEIGEEEEVEEDKDPSSTNPHCFLCEFRPSTVGGFFKHLAKKHKTTLKLQGYSIECAMCRGEFMSNEGQRKHKEIKKCEGRSFSLNKKKKEKIEFAFNTNRSFPP